MSSAFDMIEKISDECSTTFWKPFSGSLPEKSILFTSFLYFPTASNLLKKRKVHLTSSHIYRLEKTSTKIKFFSNINWKKLELFSEANDEEERFGFKLSSGEKFQDFYTKNSKDLDDWEEKLNSLVILTEFNEEFVVIKNIGKGNYGKVSLAQNRHTHEQFAVKSMKASAFKNNFQALMKLKNEIQIMRELEHPGITKLNRVYEKNNKIHLVITYYPDKDLFDRLKKVKRFSESAASEVAYNLLETLVYMHRLSFIHRDLKLENILMKSSESDTQIAICDFGLACSIHESNISKCGSPGYVAPEILYDQNYTTKVDTFSVGVIIYILLAGYSPFKGDTQEKILSKNRKCNVKFRGKVWDKHSKLASDFIFQLMNPNPEFRLSAKEALNHPWLSKHADKKLPAITPVTDYEKNDEFEVWNMPTVKFGTKNEE